MTDYGVCKMSYGIGTMPGRKQIALYRAHNAQVKVISYFKDEDEAREFMQFVDKLANKYDDPDAEWHGWAVVQK